MEVQGWVVVALTLILLAYLVPHLVRRREMLAQSRAEDRFSTSLRIVATAGHSGRRNGGEHSTGTSRAYLHDPRRGTEARTVTAPTTRAEHSAAAARRIATERATRRAQLARRQAATRRRRAISVALLALSAAAWVAVGTVGLGIAAAIVPSVVLTLVLVTGFQAGRQARRNDAADRAAIAALELRPIPRAAPGPKATTRAMSENETPAQPPQAPETTSAETAAANTETAGNETEASEPAGSELAGSERAASQALDNERATSETSAGEAVREARADLHWTPREIPQPTYQLKASAGRRDVAVDSDLLRGAGPGLHTSAATSTSPQPNPGSSRQQPAAPDPVGKDTDEASATAISETADATAEAADATSEAVNVTSDQEVPASGYEPTLSTPAGQEPTAPPTANMALEASPYGPAPATESSSEAPHTAAEYPGVDIDLDEVLARRRAMGA